MSCIWNDLVLHKDAGSIPQVDFSVGIGTRGLTARIGASPGDANQCNSDLVSTIGLGVAWQPGSTLQLFVDGRARYFDAQPRTDGSAGPTQTRGGGYAQAGVQFDLSAGKKFTLKAPVFALGGTGGFGPTNVDAGWVYPSTDGLLLDVGFHLSSYDFSRAGGVMIIAAGSGG